MRPVLLRTLHASTRSASALPPRPSRVHDKAAVEPVARTGSRRIGGRRWGRLGGQRLLLGFGQVVEELPRVAWPVAHDRRGGDAHHLLEPTSRPRSSAPESRSPLPSRSRLWQVERAVDGRAPGEDVVGDRAEGEDVGRAAPSSPVGRLRARGRAWRGRRGDPRRAACRLWQPRQRSLPSPRLATCQFMI